MQTVKFHTRVTKTGITIPFEMVKEMINKEVEIVILPIDNPGNKSRQEFTFFESKKTQDFDRADAYNEWLNTVDG